MFTGVADTANVVVVRLERGNPFRVEQRVSANFAVFAALTSFRQIAIKDA